MAKLFGVAGLLALFPLLLSACTQTQMEMAVNLLRLYYGW